MPTGYNMHRVVEYFSCLSKTYVNQRVGEKPHRISEDCCLSEVFRNPMVRSVLRHPSFAMWRTSCSTLHNL